MLMYFLFLFHLKSVIIFLLSVLLYLPIDQMSCTSLHVWVIKQSYIGETTRHLKTRANEHLKTYKDKSQV